MTIVHDENGAISCISRILSQTKPASILLFHGNSSYIQSGAKESIEPQLSGYKVIHLSGFSKSTTLADVVKAIEVMRKNSIDFIIAVGGGAVMDVAKSASLLCNEKGDAKEYILGKKKSSGNNIKRILIPTTAGTGAEITPFSAVYVDKIKYSLAHPKMVPEHVILAPELTYHLGQRITAQAGCDAIAQAIEGYWSVHATGKSKSYSEQALSLLLPSIRKAVLSPTPECRRSMLFGAHYAGKSIAIAKTTAAHAMSYPLTSFHNIPHGHAVMLTLPYFFPINESADDGNIQQKFSLVEARKTFQGILKLLVVKTGKEARDMLLTLLSDIHLEQKLSQLGVKESDLSNIVDHGFNPDRVANNPVRITKETEMEILRAIL